MQKKTLLIATVVVAAMLVLVAVLGRQQAPEIDTQARGPLFDGLKEQLGSIERIEVRDASESVTVTRSGESWTVAERDAYRADFSRLESLLSSLAAAQRLEAKTARAEQHHRLGLAGPDAEHSETVLLRLYSSGSDVPAHTLRIGKTAAGLDAQYVRIADEAQTWLVDQTFDAPAAPADWLDRDLFDLPFDRVASYSRRGAQGGDYSASKPAPMAATFTAEALPEGRSLSYESALNGPVRALSSAQLEDVRKLDDAAPGDDVVETLYTGFDGLEVRVRAWRDSDERSWVTLGAARGLPVDAEDPVSGPEAGDGGDDAAASAADPGIELNAEIEKINTDLEGWAFQVSSYTYGELTKGLEDYLADLPEETEESDAEQSGPGVEAPGPQ